MDNILICIDNTRLRQIIVNFITNAIKYKHPKRNPEILITSKCYETYTNLVVKDKKTIVSIINKMKYYMGGFGVIISCIIFLFAADILKLIYNDELITSYYIIFQILGLIGFLSSLNMLYVSLFFPAIKAFNQRLKILSMGGVFNVILVITLVQYYSIYGVAISATVSELFILIVAIQYRYSVPFL